MYIYIYLLSFVLLDYMLPCNVKCLGFGLAYLAYLLKVLFLRKQYFGISFLCKIVLTEK